MVITVIVRVKNEERNLERFVKCYHDWVDHILVQDDNSDSLDYLFDIEENYPKVKVNYVPVTQFKVGKVSRGYQDAQLNTLIFAAECLGSDWIIMDDCDCFPSKYLQKNFRNYLGKCKNKIVYATRLYTYKKDRYFPSLSKVNGEWSAALYAWRGDCGYHFIHRGTKQQKFSKNSGYAKLSPPYGLIHEPWPDDETIERKRKYYTDIYGNEYSDFNPLTFGGQLEVLPEWAKY